MNLHFFKYHGTGNDFILVDARGKGIMPDESRIKQLCDRRLGIGADGYMEMHAHHEMDFEMKYYNADGRESTMCGNGGRCIFAFASKLGIVGNDGVFLASDGKHHARILADGRISLQMNNVGKVETVSGVYFLDTGSPHCVIFTEDAEKTNVIQEGKTLRHSKMFSPGGTNVNFVQLLSPGEIYVRTYERGVENETLSCGTGVVASAISAAITTGTDKPSYKVHTPGGLLEVSFDSKNLKHFTNIRLTGPVAFVFEGDIED